MRKAARWLALVVFAMAILVSSQAVSALEGRVVDAVSGEAIAGATVTSAGHVVTSDVAGRFALADAAFSVMARAPGYRAVTLPLGGLSASTDVRLEPFRPHALYLSFYGIGYKPTREAALQLIRDSELNALVVDVKGDRGLVAYQTEVALAHAAGADRISTIPDLPGLVRTFHDEGVYAIARIVVFKDDPLAQSRPDLAVKTAKGEIFRDRERIAWTDPFRRDVWDYNVAIAVEAARAGFDEIQFDYVRFPDARDVRFSEPSTQSGRIAAISGFLAAARQALVPYNVYLAIDIFGYVCWNLDDTKIGQRIEDIVPLVDYVSPMLYPSGFQFGIPGYPDPVQHPYEIVRLSLDRAVARTRVSPLRFRPWLQAFKDYAFDRRVFDADEIKAQVTAAERFGADGWMLWNPRNVYTGTGLSP